MSLIDKAKIELARINFGDEDSAVMIEILEKFFNHFDSGGAVWAAAPVLQRLIAGKCLSPLTGDADEWMEVGDGVYQNKRIFTVFKDPCFHDGKLAYDLDNPLGPREPITFPYLPQSADVSSPVMEVTRDFNNEGDEIGGDSGGEQSDPDSIGTADMPHQTLD